MNLFPQGGSGMALRILLSATWLWALGGPGRNSVFAQAEDTAPPGKTPTKTATSDNTGKADKTETSDKPDAPVSRAEHEKLQAEMEALRQEVKALRAGQPAAGDTGDPAAEPGAAGEADESEGRAKESRGAMYDKPFLLGPSRVSIGGYFDVEYRDARNQDHDFRFHRLIPFIYADIHERISFASEIEFEDGSEVEVEFAVLDFNIARPVNFRGGVILDPLGRFNLYHDSPINDLTDRPLVNQFIIPTTLREVGAGFFGTLTHPDSQFEVKYEGYVVSGFKGLADDGTAAFTGDEGLRDGRPSKDALDTREFADNNNSFAGVGRVSLSPWLGTELGVSAHHGAYDESGDLDLTVTAVDLTVTIPAQTVGETTIGPVEVLGEAAYAFIERNSLARNADVPGDIWGFYSQLNYHFMPEFLTRNAAALFLPGSTFTAVVRWGQIDLDGHRRRRLTTGLNFRPIEQVALKFDYQFNRATGSAPRTAEDDAFLISLTSYF